MTVAGCTVPSGSNPCVMPTFLPMMPVTIYLSTFSALAAGPHPRRELTLMPRGRPLGTPPQRGCRAGDPGMAAGAVVQSPRRLALLMLFSERLDLHIDAGRQIELHQRVHRLRRRLEDVDEPLVRADLELLARLLVDVRRPQHRPLVLRRRQRNRPRQPRAGTLGRVDDLARRLIEHTVVVRLQANANLVAARCCCTISVPLVAGGA